MESSKLTASTINGVKGIHLTMIPTSIAPIPVVNSFPQTLTVNSIFLGITVILVTRSQLRLSIIPSVIIL